LYGLIKIRLYDKIIYLDFLGCEELILFGRSPGFGSINILKMRKKIIFISIFFILSAVGVYSEPVVPAGTVLKRQSAGIDGIEPFKKGERVLILAPHPDDETLGCAGIIQLALRAGAEVRVLYFTNGDSNQLAFIVYEKRLTFKPGEFIHMGEVRRKEAINAMKLLGLGEDKLIFLGYPDFGTFSILRYFWQTDKPYKSLLSRAISVPYKENLSFGAPYIGESILKDIEKVLKDYRPNKIFVSHTLDVNGDHKTLPLFLEIALADLSQELPRPRVYPYLIHWKGWPLPRHYHPELPLLPPEKLVASGIHWLKNELTAEDLERKHQAILCYKSQTESSAFYLLSFARKNELFGGYPEIDTGAAQSINYSTSGDALLMRIDKDADMKSRLSAVIYIFGYNYKTAFGLMPKIRIIVKHNKFRVLNGKKMINPQNMSLELKPTELILKIPLFLLGEPDFVLASVHGRVGILNIDTLGFRKVNIRRNQDVGTKSSQDQKT